MAARAFDLEAVGKAVDPEIIRIDMDATVINKPVASRGEAIYCVAGQAALSLQGKKDPPLLAVQANSFLKFCQPFEKFYITFAGIVGPLILLVWPVGTVDDVQNVTIYAP